MFSHHCSSHHSTEKRKSDLSFVRSQQKNISPLLSKGNLIILESTCPVGTTEMIVDLLAKMRTDPKVSLKEFNRYRYKHSCPEESCHGRILYELIEK